MWSDRSCLMGARSSAAAGRRPGRRNQGERTKARPARRAPARRSARPRRRCCGRAGPSRRLGGRGRFALRAFWAFFAGLVVEGFCARASAAAAGARCGWLRRRQRIYRERRARSGRAARSVEGLRVRLVQAKLLVNSIERYKVVEAPLPAVPTLPSISRPSPGPASTHG